MYGQCPFAQAQAPDTHGICAARRDQGPWGKGGGGGGTTPPTAAAPQPPPHCQTEGPCDHPDVRDLFDPVSGVMKELQINATIVFHAWETSPGVLPRCVAWPCVYYAW